jgi:hypothetical protein
MAKITDDLSAILARSGDAPNADELAEAGSIAVDWREDDEAIVGYVAAYLPDGLLTCVWDESGDDLIITFDGRQERAGLTISPIDRSVTICALNRIMRGQYEIRAFADYVGTGDTILITVQSAECWERVEREFPHKVRRAVVKFVVGYDIFAVRDPEDLESVSPRPWDIAVDESRASQAKSEQIVSDFRKTGRPLATPLDSLRAPVGPMKLLLVAIGVALAVLINWLRHGQ